MVINTTRFGEIEIRDDAVLHFPQGLYGMEHLRRFCLLEHEKGGGLFWLQAMDAPAVAMLVTDPFAYYPNYEVEIPDGAEQTLEAAAPTDIAVYTTITVAPDRSGIYTNLLGPLVINLLNRCGMQLIQDSRQYSTRHLIVSPWTATEAA